jgi:hypothetical protein
VVEAGWAAVAVRVGIAEHPFSKRAPFGAPFFFRPLARAH